MEALQFDPNTKVLSLIKKSIPQRVEKDEIIVRVVYAGVCGSDLHILDGSFPCLERPFTPGHEFCGVVNLVGTAVKHIKVGDRVVIDPNRGCDACGYCRDGRYNLCPEGGIDNLIGIFTDGGWSQYCTVPVRQAHPIPASMSFERAVLCEPLSCVYHGLNRILPVPHNSTILILGAGIIGNLWTCVLHHFGFRHVYISEPFADRRTLNQNLETGYQCYSPEELRAVKAADPQWAVDLCIDCSGNGQAIQDGLSLLRPGGKLCIFGCASPDTQVSINPFEMFRKELTIYGVVTNLFSFAKALHLVDTMGPKYLDFDKLGIKVYKTTQYKEAIQELKKGSISKAIFRFSL